MELLCSLLAFLLWESWPVLELTLKITASVLERAKCLSLLLMSLAATC